MINAEEILNWWKFNAVATEFKRTMQLHIDDADMMVHKNLEAGELEQAVLWNAKKACFADVLEIPDQMIEEAKEREE